MIKKISLFFLIIISLVISTIFCIQNRANNSNYEEEYRIVLKWTGIILYPTWENNNIKLQVTGNEFTRGFKVTFNGSEEEIENWLKNQPVIMNTKPVAESNDVVTYLLKPQNGAQMAKVIVNYKKLEVTIVTYWS